jgi:trans-2,3-dihydro-3-hydroxyanthranilate isomerase
VGRKYRFYLIDAFTSRPLAGNPCAVVICGDSMSPAEMQKVAREMNQSETSFLMPSKIADLRARYFTPEREIPLAGHPTIASIHAAVREKIIQPPTGLSRWTLELKEGPIKIEIEKKDKLLIRMFQRKPIFHDTHDRDEIAKMFGLAKKDLVPNAPIQTVSTGTFQLMVPLVSHKALKKLSMDVPRYKDYREKKQFFSPHFFCTQGATEKGDTFARHLGVPPDTMEDAFTGSATGGMGAYLWKYGFLKSPEFTAEQGHWMGRPGSAHVKIYGSREQIEGVSVAGYAVRMVKGVLRLEDLRQRR